MRSKVLLTAVVATISLILLAFVYGRDTVGERAVVADKSVSPDPAPAPDTPVANSSLLPANAPVPTSKDRLTLPPANRLPEIVSSASAENSTDWIFALPLEQQERARRFVENYGKAYDIESKAVQEWMLAHGFPALEEVGAFNEERLAALCDRFGCVNGKVAALAADQFINKFVEGLPPLPLTKEGGLDFGSLSSAQSAELSGTLSRAQTYIRHARENGSVIFAAHLTARLEQALGNPENARLAHSVAAACGDRRVLSPDNMTASFVLQLVPGTPQTCGFGPGQVRFPQ